MAAKDRVPQLGCRAAFPFLRAHRCGGALRREERERLIDRVISATARQLGKPASAEDRQAIKELLSKQGRPRRADWTPAQRQRLNKMARLIQSGKVSGKSEAARIVASTDPGHAAESTARWLARHYAKFAEQQRDNRAALDALKERAKRIALRADELTKK